MNRPKNVTTERRSGQQQLVTVSYISDPTAASEGIEFLDQDAIKLGKEPWLVRRVTAQLNDVLVVFHATTSRTRSLTKLSDHMMAFVAFGPRAQGSFNGVKVRPELLMAVQPGSEGEFIVEGGYESVTCMLPPAVLMTQLGARGRLDEFGTPRNVEMRKAYAGSCSRLFEPGKHLADAAEQDPDLLEGSERENAAIRLPQYCGDNTHYLPPPAQVTSRPPGAPRGRTRLHYRDYGGSRMGVLALR